MTIWRGEDNTEDEWIVETSGGNVSLSVFDSGEVAWHVYTPDQARELIEALHYAIIEVEETND